MEMTLRWYGSKFDTVTLKQIRQIPGVTGVITTLYDTSPGEIWSRERIRSLKKEIETAGLHISGIESVNLLEINVHCGDPDLFAIPSIVPVQLIVNAWAEEMELVPGSFTHGAKVTSIE